MQFGSLQITPRVCYSRPPTEAPQTDVFVEVDEIAEKKTYKRIFTGWMFADSPGLHGVEHPVYDIWLTDCKGGTTVIHEAPEVDASAPDTDAQPGDATDANAQQPPQAQTPAPQPKKKKPKPPTVVAAPPRLRPTITHRSISAARQTRASRTGGRGSPHALSSARAKRSQSASISDTVMISGGQKAMTAPMARMTSPSLAGRSSMR